MLSYLFELTICWTVLYTLYALTLREETFFKGNRAYLLFTLLAGITIPLLEWPTATSAAAVDNTVVYLQAVVIGGMEAVEISAQQTQISSSIGLTDVLLWIYFAGVLLFGMRFLYGLFQIGKLYSTSEKRIYQDTKIVLTPKKHTPFSFFNSLFIPYDFDFQKIDNQKIIEHERAHLTQRHTLDVLLLEVLSILFWCVPLIYFFKKSLRQIHEYLADAEVLKNTQKKQYGLLLLRQTHQGRMCLSLANHFNQSQLKKRIMMMTKKPSNSRASWKYLAALPLCFLLVFAFANRDKGASFSPFNLIDSSFNLTEVKFELNKITTNSIINFSGKNKEGAFTELYDYFDQLMVEYPTYRDVIKKTTEDIANTKGLKLVIDRVENSKDLYHINGMSIWEGDLLHKEEDEMPRFPGCEYLPYEEKKACAKKEMNDFVYSNIAYPEDPYKKGINADFDISITVKADGSIQGLRVEHYTLSKSNDNEGPFLDSDDLSSANPHIVGDAFRKEIQKMVDKMPNWTPRREKGKAVAYDFYLPIKFRVNTPNSNDFNPAEIKEELSKIASSQLDKHKAFITLQYRFNELVIKYPNHRTKIKQITEDVSNENGITIAVVREENSKDMYSIFNLGSIDPVYKEVDEMPRFPGCEEKPLEERKDCAQYEMLMFIYKNIKYPEEAREKDIQGTVVTRFVVSADGKIRDAQIVREIGGGCDEAVLEIVAQMPDWIPGKKDGKNVAVEYNLPVKFKLEGTKKEEADIPAPLKGKTSLDLQNFSISPNPSDGNFRVQFEGEKMPLSLVVFNSKGEQLYSQSMTDFSGRFDETISVQTSSGAVFVAITNTKEETVYWEKVLIQK